MPVKFKDFSKINFDKKDEDAVIVVQRAEGYDVKGDHKFWKHKGNRSEVRDVFCSLCGARVVMSNDLYKSYSQTKDKSKIKVVCNECLPRIQKEINDKAKNKKNQS